ncbi:hypothetical protein PpBr36_07414 [Pyricularia pennisetigena]|uniref:hypothetical protein n=1 Tax=Pyricularia pennisetigena TaxID=1578925 RepID=UPI00114E7122|nr:hypothetical protein PpBr36_07414 [Pyricularia pennisetigena]TLS25048.1 hypothetical protein PpBr36_07414 [Pyricularia pennisetigena]
MEEGVQYQHKARHPSQMAKSKAKKKASSHRQPAASVTTRAFVDGESKTKVTKLSKKKKKRAAAAAAAAAKDSQMQANSPTKPRGASSQGSALSEPAQPYPASAWNNSMLPLGMGGIRSDQNGFLPNAFIPFPGLNQPMGNFGAFGFNPLAPPFSQQRPQGHPRVPREDKARRHGVSHQAHIPTSNDRIEKNYGKRHQQKIVLAPSAESGGVPNPTPEYLNLASESPVRLESPKPILIVLDLNGTLLFRPSKNPQAFVARPHALTFLNYLLSRFWVAVWSSAQPANVDAMIDNLIVDKAQRDRLVAVWGRDRFGLSSHDYAQRVQVYKRLTRLWVDANVAASHPGIAQGERWDQTNTILVDDSVEKARSEPHNLVCVPEFVGNLHETPEVLPQVHDYLNELSFQTNVSSYMRATPFVMQ